MAEDSSGWQKVGDWLKTNAGTGAALVGSLLTGNVPGAIAAGAALVSSATGTNDATEALIQLQQDPATLVRLRELAIQEQDSIRGHILEMERIRIDAEQREHEQTQLTIRSGDNAESEYVRDTRPLIARQSWYATMAYVFLFEGAEAFKLGTGAEWDLAGLLVSPAAVYMGFRTIDKMGISRFMGKEKTK